MKYKKSEKIKEFSGVNNYHQLGENNAKKLNSGESIELKNPPKALIDGGWLEPSKAKEAK